jgi:PAS domain S-box-containing protein
MISEFLQEQAALYVSGAMTPREREDFELVLEFYQKLRAFTVDMAEVGVSVTLAALRPGGVGPSTGLKGRILGIISACPQQTIDEGLVMCGPEGLVQWINPAFSAMCGYTLEELRGKKLGPILQGEKTDRETAERLRRVVHGFRPCREVILNYRKNGESYLAEVAIIPILDGDGQPLWLAARERELTEGIPA